MTTYTLQQRIFIIQTYYENGRSVTTTLRKIRNKFGVHRRPNQSTIHRLVNKFEETGCIIDKPKKKAKVVRTTGNISIVSQSVSNDPTTSISRRSLELGISYGSVWRILNNDLHLYPYKIQLTQLLKETDHLQRRTFCSWIMEQQRKDPFFRVKFCSVMRLISPWMVSLINKIVAYGLM